MFADHFMPTEASLSDSRLRKPSHSSGGWVEMGMLHSDPLRVVGGPDLRTSVKVAG